MAYIVVLRCVENSIFKSHKTPNGFELLYQYLYICMFNSIGLIILVFILLFSICVFIIGIFSTDFHCMLVTELSFS